MIFIICFRAYSVAPLVLLLRRKLRICCFNHGLGWCDFLGAAGRFLVSLLQRAFRSPPAGAFAGSGSVNLNSKVPPIVRVSGQARSGRQRFKVAI